MKPRDLKMAIMQLKTKNGHIIRDYYIDLEELLKLYVEYTLYFNHREAQRKITDLEQMMANMDLKMERQEQIMLQQTQYMRSLGIQLEDVKDQNEGFLDSNKGLKKEVKKRFNVNWVSRSRIEHLFLKIMVRRTMIEIRLCRIEMKTYKRGLFSSSEMTMNTTHTTLSEPNMVILNVESRLKDFSSPTSDSSRF
jgi:hypothetical protein